VRVLAAAVVAVVAALSRLIKKRLGECTCLSMIGFSVNLMDFQTWCLPDEQERFSRVLHGFPRLLYVVVDIWLVLCSYVT
jgi:hypothetical protein